MNDGDSAQQAMADYNLDDMSSSRWAYDTFADIANVDENADRIVWQSSQTPDAGLLQLMKEANKPRQQPRVEPAQAWSPSPSSFTSGASSSTTTPLPARERRPPRRRGAADKQPPRESFALDVDTSLLLRYIKEVSAKVDEDAQLKTQRLERARALRRERERATARSRLAPQEGGASGSRANSSTSVSSAISRPKEKAHSRMVNSSELTDAPMDLDGSERSVPLSDEPHMNAHGAKAGSLTPATPFDPRSRNEHRLRLSAIASGNALEAVPQSSLGRNYSKGADTKVSSPLAQPPLVPIASPPSFNGVTRGVSSSATSPVETIVPEFSKRSDGLSIQSGIQAIVKPKGPPALGMRRHASSQPPSTSQSPSTGLPTKQKQFRPPLAKSKPVSAERKEAKNTSTSAQVGGTATSRIAAPNRSTSDEWAAFTRPQAQQQVQERSSSPGAGDESFRSVDFDMGIDEAEIEKVCSMYD